MNARHPLARMARMHHICGNLTKDRQVSAVPASMASGLFAKNISQHFVSLTTT